MEGVHVRIYTFLGKLEAGWRQAAGGRLEAGWRQAGGRLRQAGGRARKDLHLFGQTGGWLGAQKRCQGARPGAKTLSFACKTNEIFTILSWALAKRRYSSFNTLLVFGFANSTPFAIMVSIANGVGGIPIASHFL